ncbi:MAG: chemotaxis protein CheA [Gammaproteobacteria bacterium]|nr:chemotaxis protein CheA [Gammaproteobacteria bacterium]
MFDADDEILQDFLVEAGEILEQLGEQLVTLEKQPEDKELLNAVFRGFHTIKGGASFLNLTSLVEICHVSEDVFNQLRQGERNVDAQLMDVILRVLDSLNNMFSTVRSGEEPKPADRGLVSQLKDLLSKQGSDKSGGTQTVTHAQPQSIPATSTTPIAGVSEHEMAEVIQAIKSEIKGSGDNISDSEFENLLDNLHGQGKGPTAEPMKIEENASEITEEEFEKLLDKLQPSVKTSLSATEATGVVASIQKNTASAESNTKPIQKASNAPGNSSPRPVDSETKQGTKKIEAKQEQGGADSQAETTVRVDTKRLDDIMNMVGELVLVRNRLVTLESALGNEEVAQAIGNLDLVTADLQTAVMKTRMQPIKKVFGRFPRVVRDLARHLEKEVILEMQGEETDLDKNLVEALADPLVHLVRNAVDHGIEIPKIREAAGKSHAGHLLLAAEQEGDHILLIISDDGGGMDPAVLRDKAVEKGIMDIDAAARLTDKECFSLIFAPGFSTKQQISDISGRGVGMDVVKTRITQLNGTVDIESKKGEGTKIIIKVPLTLAIMPTLMVMLGQQIFAFPLVSVNEIFNLDLKKTKSIDGQKVVMIREKVLPIFQLKNWLVDKTSNDNYTDHGHVVVVNVGNHKVGFVVEQLIGQEEVVIKPLGSLLHGVAGLAGATITGDGRIALILDVPSLIRAHAKRR